MRNSLNLRLSSFFLLFDMNFEAEGQTIVFPLLKEHRYNAHFRPYNTKNHSNKNIKCIENKTQTIAAMRDDHGHCLTKKSQQ